MYASSVSENSSNQPYRPRIAYNFVPVPQMLTEMPRCKLRAQLILFWQIVYKNSTACGYAWFKRETVAEWLGVSVRTIQRWINALRNLRLLWVCRTGRSSEYTLINEAPASVEKLSKVTSDEPKMAHRIKNDRDLKTTESVLVVSNSGPAVENRPPKPQKDAARAATSIKTIPNEEFLALWRQERRGGGLQHARDAVKRLIETRLKQTERLDE